MQQSPWEADSFLATQKYPEFYCANSLPLVIPNQINPVHTLPSSCYKVHFNVILPSMPRSYKFSLFSRFPHCNPICISCFCTHTHTIYDPIHLICLDLIIQIIFDWKWRTWLFMHLPSVSCLLLHLRPKYFPQHPILKTPSAYVPWMQKTTSTPI